MWGTEQDHWWKKSKYPNATGGIDTPHTTSREAVLSSFGVSVKKTDV